MTETQAPLAPLARAREDLCRFLSACFYEPTEAFAEEQLFISMQQAASAIDPEWGALASQMGKAYAKKTIQELLVDYTRLFLGPVSPRASPYGSSWLAGEPGLMQETTLAVSALYEEAGFEVGDGVQDLPDHVAIELEFLYVLIFRENNAAQQGNAEELTRAKTLARRLLAEHLGNWVTPFTQAIVTGAETDFYRCLAELTRKFLSNEITAQYHVETTV